MPSGTDNPGPLEALIAAIPVVDNFEITEPEMRWARSLLNATPEAAPRVPYFGQPEIRAQIKPFLERPRFPHTLILGEPGIGKTHLARYIAGQRSTPLVEYVCPIRPEQLPASGLCLLDEVHRQGRPEWLYALMDKAEGPSLLAATTRPELLEAAFQSRFFLRLHLERYRAEHMYALARHWVKNGEASDKDLKVLVGAAAGNPRQLERIVETARGLKTFEPETVLAAARINADGLTELHLKLLKQLARMSRPIGLTQLSTLLQIDEATLRSLDRLLLEHRLVELTSSGRALTASGRQYAAAIQGT